MSAKGKKTLFFLPAFLVCSFFVNPLFAERLPVRIYTSADGLGSSFIDYLMRDSRGFMWFCTRDGLSRFDGARFVTYRIGDTNSPPGIENMYETRDSTYWVTTTGGTYRFNPNDVSPPDAVSPRLAAELVMPQRGHFFEDSKGNLWSTVYGLSRLTEKDGKSVFERVELNLTPKQDVGFNISDFAETDDNSLWLNTSWGLVRLLPDGRTVYYPVKNPATLGNTSMLADKNGRIWLAEASRILVFKPEPIESFSDSEQIITKSIEANSTFELKTQSSIPMPNISGEIIQFTKNDLNRFVENSYAKRIFQTSDDDIWITAEDNLLQFSDGIFHLHTSAEGLPTVMARMAEDAAGNLWIAGQTGLARIDRHGLTTFGKSDGANSDRFFAINEDADGNVYFAGRDFYLSRFAAGRLETVRPAIEPNSNFLWTSRFALRAANGDWWILTNQKLYRFAAMTNFAALDGKKPAKIYTKADGLKSNSVFQIFEDSGGDIWVSTREGGADENSGVARLKKGEEKFQAFTEADGLPARKSFSAAVEDQSGNIWFTFYNGGLARFDGERFEFFGEKEGLPGNNVLPDLLLDRKRRLWIASVTGGLIRVDDTSARNPTFVYLTTAEGLSSNNIRTITEDKFGRIYAGSVRGVDSILPDTGFIRHYSVNDGLAADFVVDSHCDKNGNLWFATNNGISRLVPLPDEKIAAPQIFLGGLRIAGEGQGISQLGSSQIETGELSSNQNNLQFDFFGLDFRAGETLRYQYKLEGADADWSAPTDLHTVTFANLQPASYRFLVRAVNREGAVSANPVVVSFKILPPVYARWWFITLVCLLTLGVFVTLERYRAARHRELEKAFGELSVSENRFRNLVEQSPFGIMVLAPDGSIRSVNQAYLDIWGGSATREQILSWDMQNDEQLVQSGIVEIIGRAFAGETVKAEPILYDFRKSPLNVQPGMGTVESAWLIGSVYPVKDANGNLLEVIAVLEDITARKTAEEKLERSRLERLIELEQVRARIATDLHDDIGASLTQIAILSEVARQQKIASSGENGADSEPLTQIYSVSSELVGMMSDIVWAINPQKDQLHDLTLRMRRFASDVLSAKNIDLEFNAPEDIEDFSLNSNLRREVFLIFKESINNIIKHSGATHVEVEFKINEKNLFLTVKDNGRGFDPEKNAVDSAANLYADYKGGNGLSSMRRRAAEMGGEFEISSGTGKGTIVKLWLPVAIQLDSDLKAHTN